MNNARDDDPRQREQIVPGRLAAAGWTRISRPMSRPDPEGPGDLVGLDREPAADGADGDDRDPLTLPLFSTSANQGTSTPRSTTRDSAQVTSGRPSSGRQRSTFTFKPVDREAGTASQEVRAAGAGHQPPSNEVTAPHTPAQTASGWRDERAIEAVAGAVGGPVPNAYDATSADPVWRSSAAGLDWALVASYRQQASDQLTSLTEAEDGRMDETARQELGRAIISEFLEADAAEAVSAGRPGLSPAQQRATGRAVFDALFRLGRLQPLVGDDRVETIVITGHDRVWLDLVDGRLIPGPPVADSDEELISFLVFLAERSQVNSRMFSESEPRLHLRLDGGARLAAAAWVTPRPSVVIRRHRLQSATLHDLATVRHTMSPLVAAFLQAAVRAGLSIVVSGPQGAGKTTHVRALCACLEPWEEIGTFETEYELHLHEMPDRHWIVHPWEARPGTGEVGVNGRRAGEYTLMDALTDSFRFNLDRQIVGEIRGPEVWSMIKAMESGAGSISTTHGRDAESTIEKLITCAMETGNVTKDLAASKLAATIDLVVQLRLVTLPQPDGSFQRHRWVSEIVAVEPGEQPRGWAHTHVFRSPGEAQRAVACTLPDRLKDQLVRYGFDVEAFEAEAQAQGLAQGLGVRR